MSIDLRVSARVGAFSERPGGWRRLFFQISNIYLLLCVVCCVLCILCVVYFVCCVFCVLCILCVVYFVCFVLCVVYCFALALVRLSPIQLLVSMKFRV